MKIMMMLFLLLVSHTKANTVTPYIYGFEHYYDKENIYNISTIAQAPFRLNSPVISFKHQTKTHWFKIEIENTSNHREDLIIYNAKSYYNTIKYYETDAKNKLLSTSDMSRNISYEDKSFQSILPAFRFELEAKKKKIIYIETQADIYFISKFYVTTEDGFRQTREKQNFFYILYLGMCFAIGIYFLVLFIVNKERLYFYYFIYTMLLAHFSYIYSAMYVYVNPNWLHYGFAILPLTYVFLLLITQKMLEKEKKIPFFDQIIMLFNISFIIAGSIMLFDQTLASHVYHVLLFLLIILANILLFSSSRENRIYFIAVFIYLMSMVSMPLLSMQVIPYNFFTKNINLFGSIIELTLFSFVLAKHVQSLSVDKLYAQEKLLALQKNQNTLLQAQVNKQTKSLNFLLKELHHRVKNNFQYITSFIWGQKQKNNTKETLEALEQINDRVFSISALHELLSVDTSEKLDLQVYMQSIIQSFQENHNDIAFNYDIAQIHVNYDTSITLGLILNELLTNSFKYAFKEIASPTINIKGYKVGDIYHFEYKDNGIGFDASILENTKGFGYELILEFISRLANHRLDINSKNSFTLKLSFSLRTKENIAHV